MKGSSAPFPKTLAKWDAPQTVTPSTFREYPGTCKDRQCPTVGTARWSASARDEDRWPATHQGPPLDEGSERMTDPAAFPSSAPCAEVEQGDEPPREPSRLRWWARILGVSGAGLVGWYFSAELLRTVWDQRGRVPGVWYVAIALVLLVPTSLGLFVLRARRRRLYGAIEIVAAMLVTAGAALRFGQVARDSVNALSTGAGLAAGVYFFVRGFDNYAQGVPGNGAPSPTVRDMIRPLLRPILAGLLSAALFVLAPRYGFHRSLRNPGLCHQHR